jgi:hypothetical protein
MGADERFSLRDSELDLPRSEEGERISASWTAAKQRLDPTPRDELARVFFKDSMRARLRVH